VEFVQRATETDRYTSICQQMPIEDTHAVDPRHLPDPVLTLDGESRIVAANAAACEAFGTDEGSLLGARLHSRLAEEDRKGLTLLLAAGRQGRVAEDTLPVRCATHGNTRRYLVRALPARSETERLSLVMRELTTLDRLAEESRRRAHLERTPGQFMLTLDAAGRIEHAVGLDSVLGHSPRVWIGQELTLLVEPTARPSGLLDAIWRDLAAVGRWTSMEHCLRSDGASIVVQLFATPRENATTHAPGGCYLSGLSVTPSADVIAAPVPSRAYERDVKKLTPIKPSTAVPSRPLSPSERPVVLVVDDDETMRAVVRHQLERGGFRVVESVSGRDALDRLRDGLMPHFLVVDLRMPEGSGGWLVGQVGYEFADLLSRTVVISGDASSAAAAHVTARWHCPLIAKPFNGSDLVNTLIGLASSAANVA
jgi:CheY-like chemotaxis protein